MGESVNEMTDHRENQEKLQEIVDLASNSEISSIRNVVSGILSIIHDPKSTAKDLKEIIEVDPPLTARVLRVANSAYYSPPSKIGEILKAVLWIGYDAVKELAMSQKICEAFDSDALLEGYSRIALWKHSIAIAIFGKMIYRREFGERGENMYASGLLHDIGLIVEDQFCHEEFRHALRRRNADNTELTASELKTFGFDHATLGRRVTQTWDIPEEICVAIGYHHKPYGVSQRFTRMAYTLFVANMFCREKQDGDAHNVSYDEVSFGKCLKDLGITRHALDLIWGDVRVELQKMEDRGFFA